MKDKGYHPALVTKAYENLEELFPKSTNFSPSENAALKHSNSVTESATKPVGIKDIKNRSERNRRK